MVHGQIADEAGQERKKIGYDGNFNPAAPNDPKFSGFLFDAPGFCVRGGGDQFVFADVQNTADVGKQGNIRIGNARFPYLKILFYLSASFV